MPYYPKRENYQNFWWSLLSCLKTKITEILAPARTFSAADANFYYQDPLGFSLLPYKRLINRIFLNLGGEAPKGSTFRRRTRRNILLPPSPH